MQQTLSKHDKLLFFTIGVGLVQIGFQIFAVFA